MKTLACMKETSNARTKTSTSLRQNHAKHPIFFSPGVLQISFPFPPVIVHGNDPYEDEEERHVNGR